MTPGIMAPSLSFNPRVREGRDAFKGVRLCSLPRFNPRVREGRDDLSPSI